jgi:hypothetical protein
MVLDCAFIPVKVAVALLFCVAVLVQRGLGATVKALVGVGFTVIKTVVTVEEQVGAPGLIVCKVSVLVPTALQLS